MRFLELSYHKNKMLGKAKKNAEYSKAIYLEMFIPGYTRKK